MGRRGDRSGIAIAVLLGCSLVPPINSACLNVALDDLATDLGATTADLQWVLNAYTLGYIGTLLAAARLGDAVGQVRALGTGHVVFLGATLVAAVAPSPPLLVACRFVMGVAGAVMQTMSLSLFSGLNVDPRRRARAFSWWAATASLGLTLGPILGGILLQLFWWGSIFLLNVPLLVVLTLCVVRWVPEVAPRVRGDWDVGGILLSVAGLTAVIWAVIEAPARGWTHPTTLAALAVGVAVLAAFVAWESRPEHTLLDLSYFRNAQMSASVVSFIGITFTYGGGLLLTSLTLRSTLGLSPLATGFSLTPLALAMVVAAVASAPVGRRMGLRWTITAGLALVLASSLTFALLGPEGPLPLVLALALLGAGFGLANAPAIEAVMTALPGERAGVASALNFSTRNSGLALGIAVMGSVMSGVYRDRLAAAPDIGTAEVRQAAQQSISAALGLAERLGGDGGLRLADAATTAYAGGVRTAGWVGAIVSLAGIGVALAFVPRRLAGAVRTPAPATAARARQGGPHMTEWPDSPVGRQVRWLLEAWVGEDEVPTEAASARWAPTLTFDRFSSGSSLLDPATRAAWRAEGRSRRPVARTMVVDSPHQMCLELESGDGARSWHGFVVEPDPPHRLALHYGMDTAATGERGASSTMQMGALGRAAHLVDDVPHVFDDHLAPVLLTSEYRARLPREPRRGPMFLTAVIRARLAEDVVEAAYARGGRQYVLLGAGLDSFAYRRTDLTGLRVFEVDEPVSQAWKRDRLRQVGIDEPPDLTFVPVDFDTQRLDEQLLAAGFDPRQPAAFSLLGVSGYISPAALADTLSTVGRRDGNELVFDYHCRSLETDFDRLLRAVVRASGEVNDTAYEPEEISALLAEHGFEVVADLAPDEATARYFAGRPDGLAVKGMTRLVHARRAQV